MLKRSGIATVFLNIVITKLKTTAFAVLPKKVLNVIGGKVVSLLLVRGWGSLKCKRTKIEISENRQQSNNH